MHELRESRAEAKELARKLDLTKDSMQRIENYQKELAAKDDVINEKNDRIQTLKADNFTAQKTIAMNEHDLK